MEENILEMMIVFDIVVVILSVIWVSFTRQMNSLDKKMIQEEKQ